MNCNQQLWSNWAKTIHRWGLSQLIATLLESTGPLNILGAQMIYVGQPLLGQFWPREHSDALASMLEDPQTRHAFSEYIQQHTATS